MQFLREEVGKHDLHSPLKDSHEILKGGTMIDSMHTQFYWKKLQEQFLCLLHYEIDSFSLVCMQIAIKRCWVTEKNVLHKMSGGQIELSSLA